MRSSIVLSSILIAGITLLSGNLHAQTAQEKPSNQSLIGETRGVPLGFPMQGVAVTSEGLVMAEQTLRVRVLVTQGSKDAQSIYSEDHEITTTAQGVFTLIVGRGTQASNNRTVFEEIDWSLGSYWLRYEVDLDGTGVFTSIGTTELLSVPYAMVAASSLEEGRVDTVYIPHPVDELVNENDSSVVTIGRVSTEGVMIMGQLRTGSLTFPMADSGIVGQVLATDGQGNLQFEAAGILNVASDPSPRLGGALNTNGQAITSDVRQDIELVPGGAANVVISGIRFPNKDGYPNQYLATDGRGNLTFRNLQDKKGLSSVSADPEPSLGGNLHTNGRSIVSGENQDITLAPGEGGAVTLSGLSFPTTDGSGGQILSTDGNGQLRFINSDGSSDIISNEFIYDRTNFAESIMIGDTSISGTLASATNNIGIGASTFEDLTSGQWNIAIGANMLTNLTTGRGNIFLGQTLVPRGESGETENSLTTGTTNIGIGIGALENIDTLSANIGLGEAAGYGATSGSSNIFIGRQAGYGSTLAIASRFQPGSGNVVIGLKAKISATPDISESIVIGATASGVGNSVIAIGEGSVASGFIASPLGTRRGHLETTQSPLAIKRM